MDIMHVGKFTFQLTPSRRATAFRIDSCIAVDISTHALTEGDTEGTPCTCPTVLFQLTPSRRATENA